MLRRVLSPSEVFEMVKEAWKVLIFIHGGTGSVNIQCHWWRTATKHTHLAHLEINESVQVHLKQTPLCYQTLVHLKQTPLCYQTLHRVTSHTVQLSLLLFRVDHYLWDRCVTCNLLIYGMDVLTWYSWIQ